MWFHFGHVNESVLQLSFLTVVHKVNIVTLTQQDVAVSAVQYRQTERERERGRTVYKESEAKDTISHLTTTTLRKNSLSNYCSCFQSEDLLSKNATHLTTVSILQTEDLRSKNAAHLTTVSTLQTEEPVLHGTLPQHSTFTPYPLFFPTYFVTLHINPVIKSVHGANKDIPVGEDGPFLTRQLRI